MNKIINLAIPLVMCLFLLVPGISSAQTLPDETQPYSVVILKSEHYTVRYPKNAEVYAKKTIEYAEHAYEILSKKLDVTVENITIQLFDRVDVYLDYPVADFGNGFTIYLWPPKSVFEYPYFGGWLEEQIASHTARILIQRTEMDFIHSYNNLGLPLWYLDGLANLYTFPEKPGIPRHQGLIRAIVRNAALAGVFPDIKSLMASNDNWLDGSDSEIYGSAFFNYVKEIYGIERFTHWNKLNVLNFSTIETNAETVFGKTWSELYEDWTKYEIQSAIPVKREKQYLTKPYLNEQPQWIPGHHEMSYVRNDDLRPRAIVRHDLSSHRESVAVECRGQCEHHWSTDGKTLYYSTLNKTSHYSSEMIYALPEGRPQPHKLPIPGHIRCFTIDGDNIIAVTMLEDAPQIYKYNTLTNEPAQLIYTAPAFSLIERIDTIQNGQWLAAYYDPAKDQFDLVRITDKNGAVEIDPITDDAETEMYPFVMSDKRIGYITEYAGYYYLNSISLDRSEHRILDLSDSAMVHPVEGEDGKIYYTDITHKGMTIASFVPGSYREDQDVVIMNLGIRPTEKTIQKIEPVETTYREGFDWDNLMPSSYMPSVSVSDSLGWSIGLSVENSDYLNHHHYYTYFAWYFGGKTFDLILSYLWHKYQWWILASTSVEQESYLIDNGKELKDYPITSYRASLKTGTEFQLPLVDLAISFELLAEHSKTFDNSVDEIFSKLSESISGRVNLHHRWTNAFIADLKVTHFHDAPKTLPGKTGYSFEYKFRFEPHYFLNYTYTVTNTFDLDMSWAMPWRRMDVFGLSLMYSVAATGVPFRYPLIINSGTGFEFNWFGFSDGAAFHGVRSGNLLANNHLMHGHINYILPIYIFNRNYFKIPFMIKRIGFNIVGDWAVKSNNIKRINFSKSVSGVGGEIYVDTMLLYSYPIRLMFGYERGFGKAGTDAYYLWINL